MNCKYLRLRTKNNKKYFYCSLIKKKIHRSKCYTCSKKEYKEYKRIRKRTNTLAKRENNRFSIIYNDLTKCAVCGSKLGINKHEVFYGSYRQNSIKYGMVIPLCQEHHTGNNGIHNNRDIDLYFKRLFQSEFEKTHTRDEFIKLFGKSYLK